MNLPSLSNLLPKPAAAAKRVTGVATRPKYCWDSCPFGSVGIGFTYDRCPEGAELGLLLPYPSKTDLIACRPLSSPFWFDFLLRGRNPAKVFVGHVLRCRPPTPKGKRDNDIYPAEIYRSRVESACRHWDQWGEVPGKPKEPRHGGLLAFNPDMFIVTLGLDVVRGVAAHEELIRLDIDKAYRFVARGFRPLVLLGNESMELVMPWLANKGGVKKWRGHIQEGSWNIGPARESFATGMPTAASKRKRG